MAARDMADLTADPHAPDWLRAHDAKVAARALREAALDGSLHFAATHTGRNDRGRDVIEGSWLRNRADEIERAGRAGGGA